MLITRENDAKRVRPVLLHRALGDGRFPRSSPGPGAREGLQRRVHRSLAVRSARYVASDEARLCPELLASASPFPPEVGDDGVRAGFDEHLDVTRQDLTPRL